MRDFWHTFFGFLLVSVLVVLVVGGCVVVGAGLPWLLGAGEVLWVIGGVAGAVIGSGLVIAAVETSL